MSVTFRAMLLAFSMVWIGCSAGAAEAPTADVHQQLDQILQQPIYQQWKQQQRDDLPDLQTTLPQTWNQRISHDWDAFKKWLDDLFRSSPQRPTAPSSGSGFGPSLPAVLKAFAIVVLVVAVGLLLLVFIRSLNALPAQGPMARILSREQLHEALQSGDALALGSVEWMDEARRLAMQQNFRAVYRALYLALLSGLHAAGKIEHSRNRTNWFYVSQYRGPASERTTFSDLTDLFDRVWYGRIVAAHGDLDQIRQQIAELTSAGRTP